MHLSAQTRPSATPVSAVLVTPAPENLQVLPPTLTPPPIATEIPAARLQALQTAGNVNVRPNPDIDSDILGTIAHGTEYAVLRSYFRWYEFRYDLSPTGRAWVYGDLVSVSGDISLIEVVDDPIALAGQALGAAAADDRTVALATVPAEADLSIAFAAASPLPTFTYPATQAAAFSEQLEVRQATDQPLGDLPPLFFIAVLGGLGVIGLLIGLIRG